MGFYSPRLDISVFVQHVAQGMTDHYDIKMLAHLMIIRLAGTAGLALLEGIYTRMNHFKHYRCGFPC